MSTRCQVIVKKDTKVVGNFYRHCDGYPDSMLPYLEQVIDKMIAFDKNNHPTDFDTNFNNDVWFDEHTRYYGINEDIQGDLSFIYEVDVTYESTYVLSIYDGEWGICLFDQRDGGNDLYTCLSSEKFDIMNPVIS